MSTIICKIQHIEDSWANINSGKRASMTFFDTTNTTFGYIESGLTARRLITTDTSDNILRSLGNVKINSGSWLGIGSGTARLTFASGNIALNGGDFYLDSAKAIINASDATNKHTLSSNAQALAIGGVDMLQLRYDDTNGFDLRDKRWHWLNSSSAGLFVNPQADITLPFGVLANDESHLLHCDMVNGRIGVGTDAPATLMHIKAVTPVLKVEATSGQTALAQYGYRASDGALGTLDFYNGASSDVYMGGMVILRSGASNTSIMRLYTTNAGSAVKSLELGNTGNASFVANLAAAGSLSIGTSGSTMTVGALGAERVLQVNSDPSKKAGITADGGFYVTMIAAEAVVIGNALYQSASGTGNRCSLITGTYNDMCIGIAYNNAAAGEEVIVVFSGKTPVLPNAATSFAQGDVVYANNSGCCSSSPTVPAAATHFKEVGHSLTASPSPGALTLCMVHFN
jgi:hypothetical protein